MMEEHPASIWDVELLPCDIVMVRGAGWLSRRIMKATQSRREEPSEISHVDLVDVAGAVETAEILGAVGTVRKTTIASAYADGRTGIAIARPLNLTMADEVAILETARALEGRRYGYGKLLLHLLDSWLGGRYVFRRLGSLKSWPICSWLVAHAYAAAGCGFGIAVGEATPDDIWDFCSERRDRYRWPLGQETLTLPGRWPIRTSQS
jgi:hypothetical protein